MDRLIKLLNNYLIEKDISIYTFYRDQIFNCIHRLNGERCDKERICSKSFGFIKRLVDNDKIDLCRSDIICKHRGIDLNTGEGIEAEHKCDEYEKALMLLSIDDKPLDFLILILK